MSLQLDGLLDPLLGRLETRSNDCFAYLRCTIGIEIERLLGTAGFHHHDGDVSVVEFASGNDEFKSSRIAFLERWVRHPGAVLRVRNAHCADWTIEWNTADHERCRRGVDRQHVVRVHLICTNHRDDDLGFIAETVGECWAQRTVDESAGENRLLAWTTFSAEERAGNLARGISTLFDVDSQWEKVDAVSHALCGVCGDEHGGFSDACYDGAL